MAYMCIFNHNRECDLCYECKEVHEEDYGNDDYLYDRMRDKEIDMILEEMEREENNE